MGAKRRACGSSLAFSLSFSCDAVSHMHGGPVSVISPCPSLSLRRPRRPKGRGGGGYTVSAYNPKAGASAPSLAATRRLWGMDNDRSWWCGQAPGRRVVQDGDLGLGGVFGEHPWRATSVRILSVHGRQGRLATFAEGSIGGRAVEGCIVMRHVHRWAVALAHLHRHGVRLGGSLRIGRGARKARITMGEDVKSQNGGS